MKPAYEMNRCPPLLIMKIAMPANNDVALKKLNNFSLVLIRLSCKRLASKATKVDDNVVAASTAPFQIS